jgi:hypothetical protein
VTETCGAHAVRSILYDVCTSWYVPNILVLVAIDSAGAAIAPRSSLRFWILLSIGIESTPHAHPSRCQKGGPGPALLGYCTLRTPITRYEQIQQESTLQSAPLAAQAARFVTPCRVAVSTLECAEGIANGGPAVVPKHVAGAPAGGAEMPPAAPLSAPPHQLLISSSSAPHQLLISSSSAPHQPLYSSSAALHQPSPPAPHHQSLTISPSPSVPHHQPLTISLSSPPWRRRAIQEH